MGYAKNILDEFGISFDEYVNYINHMDAPDEYEPNMVALEHDLDRHLAKIDSEIAQGRTRFDADYELYGNIMPVDTIQHQYQLVTGDFEYAPTMLRNDTPRNTPYDELTPGQRMVVDSNDPAMRAEATMEFLALERLIHDPDQEVQYLAQTAAMNLKEPLPPDTTPHPAYSNDNWVIVNDEPYTFVLEEYTYGGRDSVEVLHWNDEYQESEPWTHLTVNLPDTYTMSDASTFLNPNNGASEITDWFIQNGYANETGNVGYSGFNEYPEVILTDEFYAHAINGEQALFIPSYLDSRAYVERTQPETPTTEDDYARVDMCEDSVDRSDSYDDI